MNLFHHELLDRLYLITDMLSEQEKQEAVQYLWNLYQIVGSRISEKEENENN